MNTRLHSEHKYLRGIQYSKINKFDKILFYEYFSDFKTYIVTLKHDSTIKYNF